MLFSKALNTNIITFCYISKFSLLIYNFELILSHKGIKKFKLTVRRRLGPFSPPGARLPGFDIWTCNKNLEALKGQLLILRYVTFHPRRYTDLEYELSLHYLNIKYIFAICRLFTLLQKFHISFQFYSFFLH